MPAKSKTTRICAWCDLVFTLLISVAPLAVISMFSTVPWWFAAAYASVVTSRWFIETGEG